MGIEGGRLTEEEVLDAAGAILESEGLYRYNARLVADAATAKALWGVVGWMQNFFYENPVNDLIDELETAGIERPSVEVKA